MKKNYVKPELDAIEIIVSSMLANSPIIMPGEGGEAGDDEIGSNKRNEGWEHKWD